MTKKRKKPKKKKKVKVWTAGSKKYPTYRVHLAGSGKPVSGYYADRQMAIKVAKMKSEKTGRTYFVFKAVAKVGKRMFPRRDKKGRLLY